MSSLEEKVVVPTEQQQQPEVAQVVPETDGAEQQGKPAKPKKEKKGRAAAVAAQQQRQPVPVENIDGEFGDLPLNNSSLITGRVFANIDEKLEEQVGQKVWVRARAAAVRGKGKNAFLQLRQSLNTLQALIFAGTGEGQPSVECAKYAGKIPTESIVDIYGTIVKADQTVQSCSLHDIELYIEKIFVVSAASNQMPFQVADAARYDPTYTGLEADADNTQESVDAEGKPFVRVSQNVRLDNRYLDLRTPANQAIFRIQSRVAQYFRQFLLDRDFIEIHSPKIIPGVSEGGSAVFSLDYFGTKCCLAQSPQLYKQMAVCADFGKVFEIGDVFRAEDSNTHRHLCEFLGLDFEMEIKEHYHEVLDTLGDLFVYIFTQLNKNCQKELEVINQQYPFSPLVFQDKVLRFTFKEAHELLVAAGENHEEFADMTTAQERKLGQIVKEKYNTDLYIVDRFPQAIRPFYTMPCPDDTNYSNSYDVFLRGEEITSGAQRIHDPELLTKRAVECGIPLDGISTYIESFSNGAVAHGGAGIGLERVVFLFLGLKNIRLSSMWPRAPNRYKP